jgi:ABC-type microcin C transport system permease subunit YejE
VTKFVVGVSIAVFVLSIVGVIALDNIFAVSTASWDAQTVLIWAAVPAVFLLAIILALLNKATDQA